MRQEQWAIIGRGQASWHAEALPIRVSEHCTTGCSLSGCVDPDPLAKEAIEGCPVYDAMDADSDAFVSLVYCGPMVKAGLPSGTIDCWDSVHTIATDRPLTIDDLRTATGHSVSMAYVAPDVHMALLRSIKGVRFGTVRKGRIVWERSNAS